MFTTLNCASEDATTDDIGGSGHLKNIVPATEFESLVYTDSNYMYPEEAQSIRSGGQALAPTTDLKGDPIPDQSNAYPIGCYAFPPIYAVDFTGSVTKEGQW